MPLFDARFGGIRFGADLRRVGFSTVFAVRACRYSLRRFFKTPVFSLGCILTIAVAIGTSAAIFGVFRTVLLDSLPFKQPQQLVAITNASQIQLNTLSRGDFYDSARRLHSLEDVAEYHSTGVNLVSRTVAERRSAAEVSAAFFRVLGVMPVLGRDFSPEEDEPGQDSVILISNRLWQSKFRGDSRVIGANVSLNGLPFTVIGVLPPGMEFPAETDVWAPTIFDSDRYLREGTSVQIIALGRMSKAGTPALVGKELSAMSRQYSGEPDSLGSDASPKVELLYSKLTEKIRPALLLLNLAVLFVLIIMCANISHLILVDATARMDELAIRCALGAPRALIIQSHLVESFILCLTGGIVGVALGFAESHAIYRVAPNALGGFIAPVTTGPLVLYALLAAAITGSVAGAIPAWFVAKHSLKAIAYGGQSHRVRPARLYNALVTSEMALALILMSGVGVFVHSLSQLNRSLFSYDPHGLLTFSLSPHGEGYVDSKSHTVNTRAINGLYTHILAALDNLPDVANAAIISRAPISSRGDDVVPIGVDHKSIQAFPGAEYTVSTSYFQTIGTPIIEGRVPTDAEFGPDKILIISQSLAREFWPTESALGKRLVLPMHGLFPFTVVGVAADSSAGSKSNIAIPEIYLFVNQIYCPSATFIVRTRRKAGALVPLIKGAVAEIDPTQPIFSVETMDQRIAGYETSQRFALLMLSIFAGIALTLSLGGLYSTIHLNLQYRTHEIGLRMALGADRARILLMLLLDGCKIAVPGIIFGLLGAFLLLREATALVFGVSSIRVGYVCAIAVLFFFVTMVTATLASKGVAKVDPKGLLRVV